MHLSQPTISRDIDFIRKQNTSAEKRKNLPYRYYFEQQNALDGVGELMKNLWMIIDNPKIEVKEKIKAIKLTLYCYNMRFSLIECELLIKDFYNYAEKVKSDKETNKVREEEITRREKALQDYLDARKLTIDEFYNDPEKSDRVF